MTDIDNILGSEIYLNVIDPNTAALAIKAVGNVAQSIQKPEVGKLIAQRCGRKGLGYVLSKKKEKKICKMFSKGNG